MKRQPLSLGERIDKDYKQLSSCLSRLVQIAYEDKRQLKRLKLWYNLIGLAIEDAEEESKKNA